MERQKYEFPPINTGALYAVPAQETKTCILPVGWIAIPLIDYRSEIDDQANMAHLIEDLRARNQALSKMLDTTSGRCNAAEKKLADYEAFFAARPWMQDDLDKLVSVRRRAEQEEAEENAETEDA